MRDRDRATEIAALPATAPRMTRFMDVSISLGDVEMSVPRDWNDELESEMQKKAESYQHRCLIKSLI